jgi:serine/threonine protein kinase
VGTKLKGRYSVGKVLGQGGFGITYMGGDITLSRPVAIKELFPEGCIRNQTTVQPTRPDIQNEFAHIKQRFMEEARLLANLNHPGIVKVYDFFEENNTAYMIMELLKGKSLRQLIEEKGKIDEKEAVDYIKKVCEALSVVHKNGYLHRDIKPDNIFITEDGRAVLIDFGSAREFIAGRTKTHTVILTPGYAPFEQYSLLAERGPYTDIYALSATLYHMLTGEVPLDAPARQAGMKLRSPREINPKVSQTVSDAVMAGLEMDYKKRPQSIEDLLTLFEKELGTSELGSSKRADFELAWQKLENAHRKGEILSAIVVDRVKGGIVVDLGVYGFVPYSHLDLSQFKNPNPNYLIGQYIPLKVMELDRRKGKVVLSHKLALKEKGKKGCGGTYWGI